MSLVDLVNASVGFMLANIDFDGLESADSIDDFLKSEILKLRKQGEQYAQTLTATA